MVTTFNITIKAIVDDETGKIRFQAMAEKNEKTGQHLIWSESPYLEDAFRDLGREIKRIVYKEETNSAPNSPQEKAEPIMKDSSDNGDTLHKKIEKEQY